MQKRQSLTQGKILNGSTLEIKMSALHSVPFFTNQVSVDPLAVAAHRSGRAKISLSIRQAEFEDYPQIAALEAKYGLEVKGYEEWKHLWSDNPVCTEFPERFPIGWILEGQNQAIVGSLGNIPLFYELDGRRLVASVAHAWVAEERYRSYSLMLLEQYFSQKCVDIFLNATVGPLASESFAIFRSLPVPAGAWDRSAFWITDYRRFLEHYLRMKAVRFVQPLSYLLAVAPAIGDLFKHTGSRQHRAIELEQCFDIDDRFDRFWDALRNVNSHKLMGLRTREALEWHYKYALKQNKAWIVAARKGLELTAYAIFRRHDNSKFGLRRMRMVDFQTLDGDMTILVSMLSWAVKKCRDNNIDMMECIGFTADKEIAISRAAPYARRLPSWLYFYKVTDKSLAMTLSDPNAWDPSQYDGDASL
jgi:hypothetical protein